MDERHTTHGGKRKNAGRKPTGKRTVTRSISMPPEAWQRLDTQRGSIPRGKWIAAKLGLCQ